MNNFTEKGQTKSLGNGRCTDEKRNQRPNDILVGHLNPVSSQCARGKSSLAQKPEVHPKILKW